MNPAVVRGNTLARRQMYRAAVKNAKVLLPLLELLESRLDRQQKNISIRPDVQANKTGTLEPIPKFPLPLGEGWGEGKPSSESIEKSSNDSSHAHLGLSPAERARGGCRIGS